MPIFVRLPPAPPPVNSPAPANRRPRKRNDFPVLHLFHRWHHCVLLIALFGHAEEINLERDNFCSAGFSFDFGLAQRWR